MSALSEEQNEIIEPASDGIIPTSLFEEMVLHHENFAIDKMKTIIEKVGGKIFGGSLYD